MDKRGRWGIEIDPKKIQERREWYLTESEFYIPKSRVDRTIRISVSSAVNDRTSHIAWYVAPPVLPKRRPQPTATERSETFEEVHDEAPPEFMDDGEHHPRVPRLSSTLQERIEQLTTPTPLKTVLEGAGATRSKMANSFVHVLAMASAGTVRLKHGGQMGFNCSALISANVYREVN
jgi:hypothetical protein